MIVISGSKGGGRQGCVARPIFKFYAVFGGNDENSRFGVGAPFWEILDPPLIVKFSRAQKYYTSFRQKLKIKFLEKI